MVIIILCDFSFSNSISFISLTHCFIILSLHVIWLFKHLASVDEMAAPLNKCQTILTDTLFERYANSGRFRMR